MPSPLRLLALPAALTLVGCAPVLTLETAPPPTTSRAIITAEPSATDRVRPSQPIVVTADAGHLSEVAVLGPKGPLPGAFSADHTTWTSSAAALQYGTTYRVSATAVDVRGVRTTASHAFTTLDPEKLFQAEVVSPAPGSTVGVGTPIVVRFDRSIKNRAEVERALVVRTPQPLLGAWAWRDDSTVEFRPKEYWPGNIPVTVAIDLNGVQGGKDLFGRGSSQTSFAFGPAMVTHVNAEAHTAEVYRDGERIRTIPITTGKSGFETRSGTLVITTKERTRIMDAATGGTDRSDPEYYRLEVEYAMRITNSGEFLHAAPWSVYAQGRSNVSHGCIGMSTSNAQWLFEQSSLGDVVEIVGTSVPQNLGNGITVWTETWPEWLTRSAAGPVMTTAEEPPSAPSSPPSPSDAPAGTAPGASASPVSFDAR